MNWFEFAVYRLSGRMETPQGYGLFHWSCIALVIGATIFLCLRFGKVDEKTERKILFSGWLILLVLEIYKQLLYSVDFSETVTWDYEWYAFPFQFCSSPLYLLPIAALSHHEKIRDAVRMFLSTFSLFAGLAVYIYTDDVFSSYIGINIQTMIHHGVMIVFGIWLGGRLVRENKMKLSVFLHSCIVFLIMITIALLMNIAAPAVTDELFNMFFIGPNYPCTLVILEQIYPAVPYPVFFLIYALGFCTAAFLLYCLQKYLRALICHIKQKT